jgi:hypothetical protein
MSESAEIISLPFCARPPTADALAGVRSNAVAVLHRMFGTDPACSDDDVIEIARDVRRMAPPDMCPGIRELLLVIDELDQLHRGALLSERQ